MLPAPRMLLLLVSLCCLLAAAPVQAGPREDFQAAGEAAQAGDWETARGLYGRVAAAPGVSARNRAICLNNIGWTWLRQNRWAPARDALDQAQEADPTYPDIYLNRGLAREGLGQLEPALADLREFLRLSPGDADGQRVLARLEAARAQAGPGGGWWDQALAGGRGVATAPAAPPATPGAPDAQAAREQALCTLGPWLEKLAGGALYSPAYGGQDPLGQKIVAAHVQLVDAYARVLGDWALALGQAQEAASRLAQVRLERSDLLDRLAIFLGPQVFPWWAAQQELLPRGLDDLMRVSLARGAVGGCLEVLRGVEHPSLDLGGVEALLRLQAGLDTWQRLLDRHRREVLDPSLVIGVNLASAESGFAGFLRQPAGDLDRREREELTRFVAAMARASERLEAAGRLAQLMDRFGQEAGRAQAAEARRALPGLGAQLDQALAARPDDPDLTLLKAHLDLVAAGLGPDPARSRRWLDWPWAVSEAQAGLLDAQAPSGVLDFAGKFVQNGWDLAKGLGHAAFVDAPRVVAQGARGAIGAYAYGCQRTALKLNEGYYTPEQYEQKLASVNQEFLDDWRQGRVGVKPLQQAVRAIENGQTNLAEGIGAGVTGGVQAVTGHGLGGYPGRAAGFAGGLAYDVVTGVSKASLVILDPDASAGQKAYAAVVAGTSLVGASTCLMERTAALVGQKVVAPAARAAAARLASAAGKVLVSNPTQRRVLAQQLAPVVEMAAEWGGRALAALDTAVAGGAGQSLMATAREAAEAGLQKSLAADVKAVLAAVQDSVAGKSARELAAAYLGQFTPKELAKNYLDGMVKDAILKPSEEPTAPAKPAAPTGAAAPAGTAAPAASPPAAVASTTPPTAATDRRAQDEAAQEALAREATRREANPTGDSVDGRPVIPLDCVIDLVVWNDQDQEHKKYPFTIQVAGGQFTYQFSFPSPGGENNYEGGRFRWSPLTSVTQCQGKVTDNVLDETCHTSYDNYVTEHWYTTTEKDPATGSWTRKVPVYCRTTIRSRYHSTTHIELLLGGEIKLSGVGGESLTTTTFGEGCRNVKANPETYHSPGGQSFGDGVHGRWKLRPAGATTAQP